MTMRILVVTNDGMTFNSDIGRADEIFAGRLIEVIHFTETLRQHHDVTLAIISQKYGLITGDTIIQRYGGAPDSEEGYKEMQRRTDFSNEISRLSGSFDSVVVLVPKGIMKILIQNGALRGNVTACTSPDLRDVFQKRGWKFYERKGARIGKRNAEAIISSFSSSL